jgi:hypothetical protein
LYNSRVREIYKHLEKGCDTKKFENPRINVNNSTKSKIIFSCCSTCAISRASIFETSTWGKVRTTKIRMPKTKKNIEKILNHQNIKRVHLISIKVIRTSKIENFNYLWRISYGDQGLWGFRLGSVRIG